VRALDLPEERCRPTARWCEAMIAQLASHHRDADAVRVDDPLVDPAGRVGVLLEGELAHLAIDPGAVERHRPWRATERGDHGPDGRNVELDPLDLPEDRLLPRLVAVAGLRAPRVAWPRRSLPQFQGGVALR